MSRMESMATSDCVHTYHLHFQGQDGKIKENSKCKRYVWMDLYHFRSFFLEWTCDLLVTACQRSCGKEMFSVVSVHQSYYPQGRGVPMWPLPMMHWTWLYRCPPIRLWTPHTLDLAPPDSDIWWSLLETCSTCSFEDTSPLPRPPGVTSGSGYWSTYGWRKWVVRILLECFLFFQRLWWLSVSYINMLFTLDPPSFVLRSVSLVSSRQARCILLLVTSVSSYCQGGSGYPTRSFSCFMTSM